MLREIFGLDAVANQRRWTRSSANPIIRPTAAGWAADFIAPCSLVDWEGQLRLFVEGSGAAHEQIGLFTARTADRDLESWAPSPRNPVLRVGDGFDRGGVEVLGRAFLAVRLRV